MSLVVALERLAEKPLPVIAGGTDFYPALLDKAAPEEVIDVTQLDELKGITLNGSVWRIGAAATWTDLLRADLPLAFDALKAAAREVGSVQIQNRATLVGNICEPSPAADGVPALLALDAMVELQRAGATRQVPLSEFVTGVRTTLRQADELVTAITIPEPSATERSEFAKLGSRTYLVISIAMLAVHLDTNDQGMIKRCSLAVGSCSPVAQRLTALETTLHGMPIKTDMDIQHIKQQIQNYPFDELSPIDDVRGSADYRLSVVRSVLQRSLISVIQQFNSAASAPL